MTKTDANIATKQMLKPKIFGDLLTEVIRAKKCVSCGGCMAACPVNILHLSEGIPTLNGKCILCEYCYYQCPVQDMSIAEMEQKIFGRSRMPGDSLGIYQKYSYARTKIDIITKATQNTGVVESLLSYALENEEIDCAVIPERSNDLSSAVSKVVFTKEDLLKNAGLEYVNSPTLIGLYSAVVEYSGQHVGIVAKPCHVRAVRKTQFHHHGALKLGEKVSLVIGLFCKRPDCHLCEDFSAELADISLGKMD